ncbi:hypothetical protein QQ045_007223 [Rhodiola kirilowii]
MGSVVEKDAVEFTPFGEFICEITGACVVGVVVGSAYYFLKGIYYSPDGERFAGGTRAVRKNARRVAKGAALYHGLFNVCCRAMDYLKPKDVGIRNDIIFAGRVLAATPLLQPNILGSIGAEADEDRIELLLSKVKVKDIT